MPDYCLRVYVEPEDWSPHRYNVKNAWVSIFARADSEAEAGLKMRAYADQEGWRTLKIEESGRIDVLLTPDPENLEKRLAELGVCADIHMTAPPLTQRFSKN